MTVLCGFPNDFCFSKYQCVGTPLLATLHACKCVSFILKRMVSNPIASA